MWRLDGQVGPIEYFLVMSGCKYPYMETRRSCVAKDREQKKNQTIGIPEDGEFYDFTILRIYDFMTLHGRREKTRHV